MKTIDQPEKIKDEILAELRRHKEEIAGEHGNDVRSLGRDIQRRQKGHPRLVSPPPSAGDSKAQSGS
jgi:hypothetical protein